MRSGSGGTLCRASAVLAVSLWSAAASASPMFGTLSNFDIINDTGSVCHGFEIELEGVHPAEVVYTFGSPYIRYGDPVKIDNGTSTTVRWEAAWDSGTSTWSAGTPMADPLHPITTGGHQLWTGGDPNYLNEPGDHFGVALNGQPTNTLYRWLIDAGGGTLMTAGTNVKVPAPVWSVTPPVANPVAPAAVQAVVPAPPKQNPADQFGPAIWVKVFMTESPDPAELNHLLVGDPAVPNAGETEIEWQILQQGKGNGMDAVDSGLNDLNAGDESITRRYEFYEYVGPVDPENGEALVETPDPNDLSATVGNFLGGQNAALNLAPFLVPEPATLALLGLGSLAVLTRARRR